PYLGTAMIMSKAFAESTYSGGSMSSCSTFTLPAFRSRFSCARAVRISLALRSAFIRCSWVLSGTADEVSTEETTGGGDYMRGHATRDGDRGEFRKIRFDLRLRSSQRSSIARPRSDPDPRSDAPRARRRARSEPERR